jgi:hypothetical protein
MNDNNINCRSSRTMIVTNDEEKEMKMVRKSLPYPSIPEMKSGKKSMWAAISRSAGPMPGEEENEGGRKEGREGSKAR